MFAIGALALAGLVTATPSPHATATPANRAAAPHAAPAPSLRGPATPRASSYDEAACDDDALDVLDGAVEHADADDEEADCSAPAPMTAAPAVIDCYDTRNVWVQDMIGTCDMPRPGPPVAGAVAVRGPGSTRVRTGSGGSVDVYPLKAAPRGDPDATPALVGAVTLPHFVVASAIGGGAGPWPREPERAKIERPPRN